MNRPFKLPLLALVCVLALNACGGGGKPGASPSSPNPGSSNSSPSPGPGASSGGSTSSPKATTSTTTPRATGSPVPRATNTGGSLARLELTCARRGVDEQELTIHTEPNGPASFTTYYSDGSHVADGHSTYSSGYGGDFADENGDKSYTWVPPANAPTGLATVRVVVIDGNLDLSFKIVAQNGRC